MLLEQHAAHGHYLPAPVATVPHAVAADWPPQTIGDYAIEGEIGRGGMGVVYQALDRKLERYVALKVLSSARLENAADRERFQQEATAASKLQHRQIVPVFGVGEHKGIPFYAMQLIKGQSLEALIVARRRLQSGCDASSDSAASASTQGPAVLTDGDCGTVLRSQSTTAADVDIGSPRKIAQMALQVAEALAYAHSRGVLHRDIKPSNLILDGAGDVWITDFGLAKLEGTERADTHWRRCRHAPLHGAGTTGRL